MAKKAFASFSSFTAFVEYLTTRYRLEENSQSERELRHHARVIDLKFGRYAQIGRDPVEAVGQDDEAEVSRRRAAAMHYGLESGNWLGALEL